MILSFGRGGFVERDFICNFETQIRMKYGRNDEMGPINMRKAFWT